MPSEFKIPSSPFAFPASSGIVAGTWLALCFLFLNRWALHCPVGENPPRTQRQDHWLWQNHQAAPGHPQLQGRRDLCQRWGYKVRMAGEIRLYARCNFRRQKDQDTGRERGKDSKESNPESHSGRGCVCFLPHTCNYSELWKQRCVVVMYLPPANKIMYSITYQKRKPPDLLKFLMLKICPNVTDFIQRWFLLR